MTTAYEKTIRENLDRIYAGPVETLEQNLPATKEGPVFRFRAFAEDCALSPGHIAFSGIPDFGPKGLLISLYALQANEGALQTAPFKSFKDIPGTMPYHGAFAINSERVLLPHVPKIKEAGDRILAFFDGHPHPAGVAGDFSLLLFPLPKIALCYVFYLADEDFPASVSCLFSSNAPSFMPLDGLADVAEYTSKRMIQLL
jgi:hypothetical protein